jgi:oligopeptide/dipeptide ABC transporter ATP-binding protein
LDVTIQAQILELLSYLQQDTGISILLISHDMGVIAEVCDEVTVLYAGRVAEGGKAREIFHQPKHPYTVGLLEALPQPMNRGQILKVIPGSVPSGLHPLPGCAFAPRCHSVMDICWHAQPPFIQHSAHHKTACYLYH